MTETSIFLDANYWLALANVRDVHNNRAEAIALGVVHGDYGKTATSDYVFDEVLAVALKRRGLEEAIKLGRLILDSEASFLKVDEHIFNFAWKIFTDQKSTLSFTDCTNLVFMHALGIENIATFDKAFKEVKGIKVID